MDEGDEYIPTRQSLLERLRRWDDHEGWQEFFDTYWKLIYRTARKAGLSEAEAEDVVQETIISVARQMPHFQYRPSAEGGSFKQWLLKICKWRIGDRLRRRQRDRLLVYSHEDDSGEMHAILEIPDPLADKLDQLWNTEWERNLLAAALERVKRRADPRHFQIFHLSAVKNWSALRVARSMKVSLTQVYTVKHRLSKQLKVALAELRKHEI